MRFRLGGSAMRFELHAKPHLQTPPRRSSTGKVGHATWYASVALDLDQAVDPFARLNVESIAEGCHAASFARRSVENPNPRGSPPISLLTGNRIGRTAWASRLRV